MRNIENALRNVKKSDVPSSTFTKVDDVLRNLEYREDEKYMKPRYKKLTVVAADLIATLIITGTAFAAVTFWRQQQADLRDILDIDGKNIPEYVEYYPADTESIIENDLNETDSASVPDNNFNIDVLSSMKNQQFVYYYISVSPVTLEQAENYSWHFQREGLDGWRFAELLANEDGILDRAYNESSQSLLLKLSFLVGYDIDLDETEPFTVTLLCFNRNDPLIITDENAPMTLSQLREHVPEAFTSAEFTIVPNTMDMAIVSFRFGDGVEYTNRETGETGLILGAEVSAGGFVWIHSDSSTEKHDGGAAWINGFEDAIRDAVLVMSDGSTINAPIPMSTDTLDGILRSHAHFEFPIELSALESIILCAGEYHSDN